MIMVTEVDLLAMIVTTELRETTRHETCLQTTAPPTGAEVHLATTSLIGKAVDSTVVATAVEDSTTVEASETTVEEEVSVVMAVKEMRKRKESSKSAFASTASSRDTWPEIAPRTEIEAVQEDIHLQVVI